MLLHLVANLNSCALIINEIFNVGVVVTTTDYKAEDRQNLCRLFYYAKRSTEIGRLEFLNVRFCRVVSGLKLRHEISRDNFRVVSLS